LLTTICSILEEKETLVDPGVRHGKEEAALNESLDQLGLDYLDLWLIHWPLGSSGSVNSYDYSKVGYISPSMNLDSDRFLKTWKAMEKLVRPSRGTRFIGIANFSPEQLDDILKIATIKPKVHQMELHPYLQQQEFVEANMKSNISVTAYTPLGNTNPAYGYLNNKNIKILNNPVITEIAKARSCTAAQVVLAWNMKRDVAVIPKAAQAGHRKENIETVEKCKLTSEDSDKIKNLGVSLRLSSAVCMIPGFDKDCFKGLSGV
jgi:alcohol dehydrogenase (NADP+)